MLVEEMRAALAAAPLERLCDLSKALWQSFAAGALSEADAEALSTLIEARRAVGEAVSNIHGLGPAGRVGKFAGPQPRRPQRPPLRSVAIERRRRWAAAGRMPPAIAAHFTTGEQAALAVVAVEVVKRKACTMPIGAIAALAGVSESTVKRALRHARALGLVQIRERRLSRYRSDTNVLTIISREWLSWLELRRSGGGGQGRTGTNTSDLQGEVRAGLKALARGAAYSHNAQYEPKTAPSRKCSEGLKRAGG